MRSDIINSLLLLAFFVPYARTFCLKSLGRFYVPRWSLIRSLINPHFLYYDGARKAGHCMRWKIMRCRPGEQVHCYICM